MTDIRTGKDINFTGDKSTPGVSVSDFRKKETEGVQSTLDKRILIAYNERFAYFDFKESEMHQYTNELSDNHNSPILKEIRISDHKFLSYVYDIDNPNLITLNLEGHTMETEEDKSKLRLVVNQEKEDNLQFYHDIFYNENTHHNDEEICSKLIFDINNERMMRLLGLDTQYNNNNNNNFSKSLWKEKRYIIADHLLCEFVIICNQILEAVRWRMENAYPHKIWPKSKFPEIHKRFRKWHDLVYGKHRRTAETFISLDKAKVKLNKL